MKGSFSPEGEMSDYIQNPFSPTKGDGYSGWALREPIERGAFGEVFICRYWNSSTLRAMKVEKRYKRLNCMANEVAILKTMKNVPGFPTLLSSGSNENFNWFVMTKHGESLYSLIFSNRIPCSISNAIYLSFETLDRIKDLHVKGFIHRDIKPNNFLYGIRSDLVKVFMCDFGLSRSYLENNNQHICMLENRRMVGTLKYASLNNHNGLTLSRRDDLESWFYMLMFFILGFLPWDCVPCNSNQEKKTQICNMKLDYNLWYQSMPPPIMAIFFYIRRLSFDETPDYDFVESLMWKVLNREDDKLMCCLDLKCSNNKSCYNAKTSQLTSFSMPT